MRYFLSLVIGLLLFKPFGVQAQANAETAKTFGLSLIQAYYDNQCTYVFDHLDQTVISLQGGQSLPIQENMRNLFCEDMPVRKDIGNSYAQYQENYRPQVYDQKAFKKQFPAWAQHITLQAGDFFFDGGHPKAAGHTRLFTSENQVRFVLRYTAGDWVIIAI